MPPQNKVHRLQRELGLTAASGSCPRTNAPRDMIVCPDGYANLAADEPPSAGLFLGAALRRMPTADAERETKPEGQHRKGSGGTRPKAPFRPTRALGVRRRHAPRR